MFKPSIFDNAKKLENRRKVVPRSVDLYDGSPNDPISQAQIAILEAAAGKPVVAAAPVVNGTADSTLPVSTPQRPQPNPFNLLSRLTEAENTPRSSVAGSPGPEGTGTPNPERDTPMGDVEGQPLIFRDPVLEKTKLAEARDAVLPVTPLDHAILESLAQGARGDDRKLRDFFGGIMLVGGTSKTPGLREFIEARLRELRPFYGKEILVGPPPREFDPQVVAWKGGSVFGRLSSHGNDSWISKYEYDMLGARLLNNKCMFAW
jgi:actin-related protein 8